MPNSKTKPRAQRFKKLIGPDSKTIVSAAVSIDSALYLKALSVADRHAEGNFSRYVRGLIRRDLGSAA